jgi:peptide subunit release factor 1 (eRF1)
MTGVDAHVIRFQCPKCGHELEQSIGDLKSREHMRCPACGVGINIDTNRLASAAEEMQKAIEKVPPEITIIVTGADQGPAVMGLGARRGRMIAAEAAFSRRI